MCKVSNGKFCCRAKHPSVGKAKNFLCFPKIKLIWKTKGLKQDELAELLGLEVKSLSLIETGNGFVSAKTLEKLISVLNVSLGDLFGELNEEEASVLYKQVLDKLELIKNNPAKLNTALMVIKSLV